MCVWVCVSVCECLSVRVSVCESIWVRVSVCKQAYVCACMQLCLFVCLSVFVYVLSLCMQMQENAQSKMCSFEAAIPSQHLWQEEKQNEFVFRCLNIEGLVALISRIFQHNLVFTTLTFECWHRIQLLLLLFAWKKPIGTQKIQLAWLLEVPSSRY